MARSQIAQHGRGLTPERGIGSNQAESDRKKHRAKCRSARWREHPGVAEVHQVADDTPGRERTNRNSEYRGDKSKQQILQSVRQNELPPRGAQRFQNYGIIDAMTM